MAKHIHRDLVSPAHLKGIAAAASEIIAGAQHAYQCGLFPAIIRDNLTTVQHDLIRLLAIHEDGMGYGRAPVDLVVYLRNLEQVASDLLEEAAIDDIATSN